VSAADAIVIVGTGAAGVGAAFALRSAGCTAPIVLIGDEPHPPYDRPPLSKAVLLGRLPPERTQMRRQEIYAQRGFDLRLNRQAVALDRTARRVLLDDGSAIEYAQLVLATGARPRRLDVPGADLDCIHVLRTLDDAVSLRDALVGSPRLLVVGGGYLGLEAAASARKRGAHVTVVECAARLLPHVASDEMARFVRRLHETEGVEIRTGATLRTLHGTGFVQQAELADGTRIDVDRVLFAVGAMPETSLAVSSGLAVADGIQVDASLRTEDPHIWAAGDVARCGPRRVESIANAQLHARIVAASILGQVPPRAEPAWFWTDQYEVKLQTVGLLREDDEKLVRGSPLRRSFAVLHLRDGRVSAIELLNRIGDLPAARRLVAAGATLDEAQLAFQHPDHERQIA
jgi:3-phenylpropionate/trans-cinnamate dioxygenase ferredoxin reductase subunit